MQHRFRLTGLDPRRCFIYPRCSLRKAISTSWTCRMKTDRARWKEDFYPSTWLMTLARVYFLRGRSETEREATLLTEGKREQRRRSSAGWPGSAIRENVFLRETRHFLQSPTARRSSWYPVRGCPSLSLSLSLSLACEIETTLGSRDAQVNNVVLLSGILRASMVNLAGDFRDA